MTKDKKITLNSDISELQGIGAAIKEKLNKVKIMRNIYKANLNAFFIHFI